MTYYDTHAHFESSSPAETELIIQRAFSAGVTRIMAVGGSPELNASAIAAATAHPANISAALGFDRDMATELSADVACDTLRNLISATAAHTACIGEIGLDYFYAPQTRTQQMELFKAQLALAVELALPVCIHTRDADSDTLSCLDAVPWPHSSSRGIIHCFTGSQEFADELLARGFMMSFSGIVTFRNADPLRKVAASIPNDRLLIETDSPFLAPVPKRGNRNEPAFVIHVAELLATVRGTTPEAIAALTTSNALATLHTK